MDPAARAHPPAASGYSSVSIETVSRDLTRNTGTAFAS